uniref:Putative salivary secreted peptide n=1 Tax=Psorophora albipes TaxID=869069 RepID=T1E3H5_9DIPT
MVKFALLFIVIFCVVQLTFAARIRRDNIFDAIYQADDGSTTMTQDEYKAKMRELGKELEKKFLEAINQASQND